MRLYDTHAHLDDEQFTDILPQVLDRARQASVEQIVCIGTTADSSENCVRIAVENSKILNAAVGIQPNYCAEAKSADWDRIIVLSEDPKVGCRRGNRAGSLLGLFSV